MSQTGTSHSQPQLLQDRDKCYCNALKIIFICSISLILNPFLLHGFGILEPSILGISMAYLLLHLKNFKKSDISIFNKIRLSHLNTQRWNRRTRWQTGRPWWWAWGCWGSGPPRTHVLSACSRLGRIPQQHSRDIESPLGTQTTAAWPRWWSWRRTTPSLRWGWMTCIFSRWIASD